MVEHLSADHAPLSMLDSASWTQQVGLSMLKTSQGLSFGHFACRKRLPTRPKLSFQLGGKTAQDVLMRDYKHQVSCTPDAATRVHGSVPERQCLLEHVV